MCWKRLFYSNSLVNFNVQKMIWEYIDRIQDVLTLIGMPIAIYLLWKIWKNAKRP